MFRDDHEFQDDILPVRTVQQIEAYLLSTVAVMKSYMTTGVRVTATEILALMSRVREDAWSGFASKCNQRERERERDRRISQNTKRCSEHVCVPPAGPTSFVERAKKWEIGLVVYTYAQE